MPISGLLELMAQSRGETAAPYPSLEAARADREAAVVLSGDWGGTVLLTVPLRLVRCDLAVLRRLAVVLDREIWDDPDGVELSILRHPIGSGVAGGMGGGLVVDGIWLHPRLDSALTDYASAVLDGSAAPD